MTEGIVEHKAHKSSTAPWPLKRLRFLTYSMPQHDVESLLDASSEVPFLPMHAIGERGQIDPSEMRSVDDVRTGYTLFVDGDVVVAKITPCFENGKGALIRGMPNGVGFGTTELYVLRPGPELDGRFLYYLTVDPRFRRLGEACMMGAAGQQRVPKEFIRDTRVAVPRLPQQRAIADYLDRETTRLDMLVAEKRRLLSLLEEKRHALIVRAVTRGLDSDVAFRDSRISWLRRVPVHWQMERARWLFRERDDRSENGDEELLTVSHLTGVTPRSEKDVSMFEAETTQGYKICLKGDLVINTLWAWLGAKGVSPVNGVVSPAYNVYEPIHQLDAGYIDALVRLRMFAQEVTRYSKGVWSSRLRLYPDGFFETIIPVPPLKEQQKIALFVQTRGKFLETIQAATVRTISLLQERRAALIATALTGRIDVWGAA